METSLFSAEVRKYALGRGTVGVKNWKTRLLLLSTKTLQLFDPSDLKKPKLSVAVRDVAVVVSHPPASMHPQGGRGMVLMRLFDNDVFDLVVQPEGDEVVEELMSAWRRVASKIKGLQVVSGDIDAMEVPSPRENPKPQRESPEDGPLDLDDL